MIQELHDRTKGHVLFGGHFGSGIAIRAKSTKVKNVTHTIMSLVSEQRAAARGKGKNTWFDYKCISKVPQQLISRHFITEMLQ